MPTLNSLYVSQIAGINVTQIKESTLSGENKKADYENPLSNNEVVDLGKAQEKKTILVRVISDDLFNQLLEVCRNQRETTITDKFTGEFDVFIDKYSIVNSDSTIQWYIFSLDLTILEAKETPRPNLKTILFNDSKILENEIFNIPAPVSENGFLEQLSDGYTNTKDSFNQVQNFIDAPFDTITNYTNSIESYTSDISKMVLDFSLYQNNIVNVKSSILGLFSGIQNPILRNKNTNDAINSIVSTQQQDPTSTRSSFERVRIENNNKILQGQALTAASLKLEFISDVELQNSEEALSLQQEFNDLLDFVSDGEDVNPSRNLNDTKQDIKTNVSDYIQSLDLPTIVEIDVKNKPLLVLSYDLYETIDRADEIKELNGFVEGDSVTGTVKVLSS